MIGRGITERGHARMVEEAAAKARAYQIQRYTQEDIDKFEPDYRRGIQTSPVTNMWSMSAGAKPPCKASIRRDADSILSILDCAKNKTTIRTETGMKKNNVERAIAMLMNEYSIRIRPGKGRVKFYERMQEPE